MDHRQPDSSLQGILQAIILEWVAMPPGDLSDTGMEPESLRPPMLAGRFFTASPPGLVGYLG